MDGRQDEAARLPLGFVLDRPRSALPPGFVFDPKPSDKWGKDPIVKPATHDAGRGGAIPWGDPHKARGAD